MSGSLLALHKAASKVAPKAEIGSADAKGTVANLPNASSFDCRANLNSSREGWSQEKRRWCCRHSNTGCEEFECFVDTEEWKTDWSEEQKTFCCKQNGLGCEDQAGKSDSFLFDLGFAVSVCVILALICCFAVKRNCDDSARNPDLRTTSLQDRRRSLSSGGASPRGSRVLLESEEVQLQDLPLEHGRRHSRSKSSASRTGSSMASLPETDKTASLASSDAGSVVPPIVLDAGDPLPLSRVPTSLDTNSSGGSAPAFSRTNSGDQFKLHPGWLEVAADGSASFDDCASPRSVSSASTVFPAPDGGSFQDEDGMISVGQELELAYNGSVLLCQVTNMNQDHLDYPYTVHFPSGELSDQLVMLDLNSSRYYMDGVRRPFRFIDPEELVSEDDVIADILEDNELNLSEPQLVSFVRRAREAFQTEPPLLEIDLDGTGIAIFGDLHGDFQSLTALLEACAKRPPEQKLLFLGDYVDRGPNSLEVLTLLLAWKIKYPKHIFMLRGNHEDLSVNAHYGFCSECKRRMSIQIYRQVNNMFHYMPVAAVVDKKLFCCHGGIGPDMKSLADIKALQEHVPLEVPLEATEVWQTVLQDLLWADPCESGKLEEDGFAFNAGRKISVVWGSKATERFLAATGLEMIVRAHELVQGYAFSHDGKVLTLFSSANYCGNTNSAAAVYFDGDVSNLGVWEIDHNRSYIAAAPRQ